VRGNQGDWSHGPGAIWHTKDIDWDGTCSAETVKARITYKICNLNRFDDIEPTSVVEYDGELRELEQSDILLAGQCESFDIELDWELCDVNLATGTKVHTMGIQLNARIVNDMHEPLINKENGDCSCK